jgi:hypothetical protein
MMEATERQRLADRFNVMKSKDGLTDMKFHLGSVSETTTEAVCGAVNFMLDKLQRNEVYKLVRDTETS